MPKDNTRSYKCCIIGAGPAGLGVALELLRNSIDSIIIIDRNKRVGGLSRTDVFEGKRFDIGPHRFFTKNKEVNKIWHETLGSDFRPVSRLTRISYKNQYLQYPIRPLDVLTKLGPTEVLHIVFSFFSAQMAKKNKAVTFEDWIIQRFGRKLYKIFFKAYTEKIWGMPCSDIGAEWAAQRIKGLDALEIIKNVFGIDRARKNRTLVEEFDYPVLGAGQMYEVMCDKIMDRGAELMLETQVIRFNRVGNKISSIDVTATDGHKCNIAAEQFFSSIPLVRFFNMLVPPETTHINDAVKMLRYRNHITVNLLVNKQNLFPDQWLYLHSPEVHMARLTNYNNFSKAMVGSMNKTALSAEYFVSKNENMWKEPDNYLKKLAISELSEMNFINENDIEKIWLVKETESYPVYDIGLQEHLKPLSKRIDEYENFYSIGRAGLHKYNNQDHSLVTGILAARNYLKLPYFPYRLWDYDVDDEY